jgi:hypothetical protein
MGLAVSRGVNPRKNSEESEKLWMIISLLLLSERHIEASRSFSRKLETPP